MPYASNAELPEYVKKLPEKKQRQWRHIVNQCLADGKPESRCFAMANGVTHKDVDIPTQDPLDQLPERIIDPFVLALAEKAYPFVDDEPVVVAADAEEPTAVGSVVLDSMAPSSDKSVSVTAKSGGLLTTILRWMGGAAQHPAPVTGAPGAGRGEGLLVVKQADGRLRWFARYSNAWEDRDGEIVTEASHKLYLGHVDKSRMYPELWLWHTPGTRFGEADWLDFSDGFAYASGLIDEGREDVVDRLAGKELGVSHGMLCAQDGKYITKHFTFEITVLPRERASVWTTDFNVLAAKESDMAFTAERRQFLVDLVGEETVKNLETQNETVSKQMRDLGVEYKETAEQEKADALAGAEALKAIAELSANVGSLVSVVKAIRKDVDELKNPTGAAQEADFLAKLEKALAGGGAARPTESKDNVVAKDKAEAAAVAGSDGEADFFATMMKQAFSEVPKGPPAGTAAVTVQE